MKQWQLKIFWIKNAKTTKQSHAYKGYSITYNVLISSSFNSELHLKDPESWNRKKLINLLVELKGFKFAKTLILEFRKKIENVHQTKYSTFYSDSIAETITHESDIDDLFESIYSTIISNRQNSQRRGSDWIIDSFLGYTINILNYNPLVGSSYTELPKVLDHPRKASLIFKILMIMNALNDV